MTCEGNIIPQQSQSQSQLQDPNVTNFPSYPFLDSWISSHDNDYEKNESNTLTPINHMNISSRFYDHKCTYQHRNITKDDARFCNNATNSIPLENFFQLRGWIRKAASKTHQDSGSSRYSTHHEDTKQTKTTTVNNADNSVDLEMLADMNKRKHTIMALDVHQIRAIRLKSNATWTWIPDFRPLSDKWMLSLYLDQFLSQQNHKQQQQQQQQNKERFHFRSWAVTAKQIGSESTSQQKQQSIPFGQYTISEVLKLLKHEEETRCAEQKSKMNHQLSDNADMMNDWIPSDGYYVKPGGAMSGGGRNVNFVPDLKQLELYLQQWAKARQKEHKLGAVCLVQQAMANRRRMIWDHHDGVPKFFEVRVMTLITGMEMDDKTGVDIVSSSLPFNKGSNNKCMCMALQNQSVYILPKLRLKTLPVPKQEEREKGKVGGAFLLNKKIQEKRNNSAHSCSSSVTTNESEGHNSDKTQDRYRSKATMFNSYSLIDLLKTIPKHERDDSWIAKIMLPQILDAIHDTAKACCFPCFPATTNKTPHQKYHENNHSYPHIYDDMNTLAKGALLVSAFDFIIDVHGKPWLLEVNTKPWLRWAGVNTVNAYPHELARDISAEVLDGLLRMIAATKE